MPKTSGAGTRRGETTIQEVFGLSDAEVEMFDCRIAVTKAIRRARRERGLTQPQMAEMTGLTQARISLVERGDPGVSLSLIVEAFFALGHTRHDLAKVLDGDISYPDVADSAPAEPKRSPRAEKIRSVARRGPKKAAAKKAASRQAPKSR